MRSHLKIDVSLIPVLRGLYDLIFCFFTSILFQGIPGLDGTRIRQDNTAGTSAVIRRNPLRRSPPLPLNAEEPFFSTVDIDDNITPPDLP
jgi:hypothetical protein